MMILTMLFGVFLDEIKHSVPDGKIFHKDSVSVYSPTDKEIHKGLNPEEKIIEAMDSALKLLKNENLDILGVFRCSITCSGISTHSMTETEEQADLSAAIFFRRSLTDLSATVSPTL